MLDQALEFIKAGFIIFPVKNKQPLTKHGFKDATNDPGQIEAWWTQWPDADVGLPTGQVNMITVIDVDNKDGNGEARLESVGYEVACGTISGGAHILSKYDSEIKTTRGIEDQIDIRNDASYIVAYADAATYVDGQKASLRNPDRWKKPPPPMPKFENGELIGEGYRHGYLLSMAGRLRRAGLGADEILAALEVVNENRLDPPMTPAELSKIAVSMETYESNDPVDPDKRSFYSLADIADEAYEHMLDPTRHQGVPSGFELIDYALGGGLRDHELTVIHALAKTGKSTLIHQMMLSLANAGHGVGYASREMIPTTEVFPEFVSVTQRMNAWTKVPTREQVDKVAALPIYFSDGYGVMEPENVEKFVLDMIHMGVRYVFIDHLHYMVGEENDVNRIGNMIKMLKEFTARYPLHIVLIVQPNQVPDGVELSFRTLKGGSSISQAMNNMFTLVREPEMKNVSRISLFAARHKQAKQKYTFYLHYDPETSRLEEGELETEDMIERPERSNTLQLRTV